MRQHQADYIFIMVVFFLVFLGLVFLASASTVLSQNLFKENYYFLKHQIFYGLFLGILGFFICQRINYQYWQKLAFPLLIFSLILLGLVFLPGLNYSSGEAKRWITFGQFSIQPFEFVKLSLVIYLAALLSKKGESQQIIKSSIIPVLVVLAIISALLICQPNMSALVIVFLTVGLIYFLADMRIYYLIGFLLLALLSFFALIKITGYRSDRLMVYLHPEMDPQGIGYQINQALLAIGSGGLFGLGLGHSVQKWQYLPESIGDSVFAIIAEETGLVGASFLVILFMLLAWRGLKIAREAPNKFGYLLAAGLTGCILIQVFINITAISGLIPLTGIPLPFVSYGGSALVASLTAMGILANISKHTKS